MIIKVKAPAELKPQHIFKISPSNNLPLGLIPLAVDHTINQKYSKLLNISILTMAHCRVYIPRSAVFGMLKPVEIENAEICETFWTKIKKLNENTLNNFDELCCHSQNSNELQNILSHSSFQHEPNNYNRQSVILEDAQVPQEAQDKLSLLLQTKFDSLVTKSSTDVERSDLFKMHISTTGTPMHASYTQFHLNTKSSLMNKYNF